MLRSISPLKVAVLCSHRAPGLLELLRSDRRRGRQYEIVCCATSSEAFTEGPAIEAYHVPFFSMPIRPFCRARGASLRDPVARRAYDAAMVDALTPFNPDIVVLDGYLLLLTAPMLDRFQGRIINIHHSDLTLLDAAGLPRYPGLRAVRDALFDGALETRATAHIVTERLDEGPVLLRSWPFEVPPAARWAYEHDAVDLLKAYVWVHQEWMLREAWPVMLARSIALAAARFEGPETPLNVQAWGSWVTTADGTLAPDSRSGERRAAAQLKVAKGGELPARA